MLKQLIKSPIFRICGVAAILYYGLFSNKYDPDGLGNRLAPEKIKANLSDISAKSVYIIDNVKKAETIKKTMAQEEEAKALNEKNEKNKKENEDEQK